MSRTDTTRPEKSKLKWKEQQLQAPLHARSPRPNESKDAKIASETWKMKRGRLLTLTSSALAATALNGCAVFVKPPPEAPTHLIECAKAAGALVEIVPGPWTKAETEIVIGRLMLSEERKGWCAQEWARYYEDLRS